MVLQGHYSDQQHDTRMLTSSPGMVASDQGQNERALVSNMHSLGMTSMARQQSAPSPYSFGYPQHFSNNMINSLTAETANLEQSEKPLLSQMSYPSTIPPLQTYSPFFPKSRSPDQKTKSLVPDTSSQPEPVPVPQKVDQTSPSPVPSPQTSDSSSLSPVQDKTDSSSIYLRVTPKNREKDRYLTALALIEMSQLWTSEPMNILY